MLSAGYATFSGVAFLVRVYAKAKKRVLSVQSNIDT